MRNIMSIDPEAWRLIKHGVTLKDPADPTEDEKKLQLLDKQAWVFITNHMTREQ